MTIQVDWSSPGGTLPLDFPYGYRNPREPYFLGPQAEDRTEVIEMPGANALINDGNDVIGLRPLMFIWGRADYEDVFGKSHFVQWCYRVRFERHRGERLRADFIQCGNHNRSDEDDRA